MSASCRSRLQYALPFARSEKPCKIEGMQNRRKEFFQAITLREQGHQVKEISQTLGIPLRTIQLWFAKYKADPEYCPATHREISAAGGRKGGVVTGQRKRRLRSMSQTPPEVLAMLAHAVERAEAQDAMREKPESTPIAPEVPLEERLTSVREHAGKGDFLQTGAELSDASPEEWEELGKVFRPDFLKSWQCGRLFFYLASGIHRAISLARVGIRPADFELWLARASNHAEPFATFIDLCSMAQASACARLQRQVMKKSPGWQALSWSLEKLSPEIFAKHVLEERSLEESSFADVGDDNLKRTALAYIVASNDRKPADVEFVDLDEIEGRNE